jgi:hypothetical protein
MRLPSINHAAVLDRRFTHAIADVHVCEQGERRRILRTAYAGRAIMSSAARTALAGIERFSSPRLLYVWLKKARQRHGNVSCLNCFRIQSQQAMTFLP